MAQYASTFAACLGSWGHNLTIRFIARLPGTVALAQKKASKSHVIDHVDVTDFQPGGMATGTLSVNSAVEVRSHGDRCPSPSSAPSPKPRGSGPSSEDMRCCEARIDEFAFQPVTRKSHDGKRRKSIG
ncbi:CRISPR-associated protein Csx16 [Methylocaldum szegediense]|uniref:CRISPR-associated protein Csx16 n=1 Tax=Methylocaldum szegediense TaxID=73780 RepID=A0ABM9I9E4_9GAMM|nr:putative CRISPR-associated protein Csx16 [Methylocaldum szegediense]